MGRDGGEWKAKKPANAHKAAGCGGGKTQKNETTGLKRMTQIKSHQARVYQFETYQKSYFNMLSPHLSASALGRVLRNKIKKKK